MNKFNFKTPTIADGIAIVKVEDNDAFFDRLPEGLTKKNVEATFKMVNDYTNEVALEGSANAIEVFNANKGVKRVDTTFPFGPGAGAATVTVKRDVERLVKGEPMVGHETSIRVSHRALKISGPIKEEIKASLKKSINK